MQTSELAIVDLSLERRGGATVADVVRDMSGVAGNLSGDLASSIEDSSSLDKFTLSSQSGGDAPEYLHSRLWCTTFGLLFGFEFGRLHHWFSWSPDKGLAKVLSILKIHPSFVVDCTAKQGHLSQVKFC